MYTDNMVLYLAIKIMVMNGRQKDENMFDSHLENQADYKTAYTI